MLALAFLVSVGLAGFEAKREGIDKELIFNLWFITLIFGLIGARIFYVIENLDFYLREPLEIIMLQRGGLSWFGGLILGSCAAVIYLRSKKIPVYKVLDVIAPFLALAQAIGRIGCLLNGCCFGRTVIPIQVYSSLILLFIFIALRLTQGHKHKEGAIFFLYLALYSIKRFFIEFWRVDNEVIFSGLTLFQIISILIFCLASIKLIIINKVKK